MTTLLKLLPYLQGGLMGMFGLDTASDVSVIETISSIENTNLLIAILVVAVLQLVGKFLPKTADK